MFHVPTLSLRGVQVFAADCGVLVFDGFVFYPASPEKGAIIPSKLFCYSYSYHLLNNNIIVVMVIEAVFFHSRVPFLPLSWLKYSFPPEKRVFIVWIDPKFNPKPNPYSKLTLNAVLLKTCNNS